MWCVCFTKRVGGVGKYINGMANYIPTDHTAAAAAAAAAHSSINQSISGSANQSIFQYPSDVE